MVAVLVLQILDTCKSVERSLAIIYDAMYATMTQAFQSSTHQSLRQAHPSSPRAFGLYKLTVAAKDKAGGVVAVEAVITPTLILWA